MASIPLEESFKEPLIAQRKFHRQFDAIYERDSAGLLRVAKLYGGLDYEDLYQDIALAIWLALRQFREQSSLRTFAYRIAHNRGVSFRSRRRHEPLEHEVPGNANIDAELLAERRHAQLILAIRSLPEQTQKVITLSLEGLTYAEIAGVVGITENNVGVVLNRGKKKLTELLQEED